MFLVVPSLFFHLPSPAIAGAMAAKLFTAQTWVSVVCGLLLLLRSRLKTMITQDRLINDATLFIVSGIFLALFVQYAVAPKILARDNLALWHSVGSLMYALQWLCAIGVFWKICVRDGLQGASLDDSDGPDLREKA